jgi:hypothetical protein
MGREYKYNSVFNIAENRGSRLGLGRVEIGRGRVALPSRTAS